MIGGGWRLEWAELEWPVGRVVGSRICWLAEALGWHVEMSQSVTAWTRGEAGQ